MIKKHKLSTCKTCGKPSAQTMAGRCIQSPWCYQKHRNEVSAERKEKRATGPEIKPRTPIKKVSDKQAKLNAAYSVLATQYKKDNPYCKAALADCQYLTSDVHHKRGRGEYLLDSRFFLPVCRACHNWIENHPEKAKELGLSEDRL